MPAEAPDSSAEQGIAPELEELRRQLAASNEQCAALQRTASALLASEQKYRVLLDESSDPTFAIDRDGRYGYVNRAFADGVGMSQEDIVDRKIWDVFPKAEADKRFAAVKSVLDDGDTRVIEVSVPRPDGNRTYITTIKPIFDDEGRVNSVICSSKDISERKRVEERLRESEQRFRLIVENLNDVLFTLTPSGNFGYVSPQWKEAFGYELDETIGQPFTRFVHPDDIPGFFDFLQRVLTTGKKQSGIEYRVLCKDGTWLWYRANASLMIDTVSGAPMLVGIGRDITELKRMEESIRFRQFGLDQAEEGIFWIDSEAHVLDANETACRALGYSLAEMRKLSVPDFDPFFPVEKWPDHWRELKRKKTLRFESALKARDGRVFPTEIIANYFEYDGIEYNCALARDISDRRRIEERMQLAAQIFDTASEAIFVSDLDGKLLDVNAEACRLAKYSREEMLTLRNVDIVAQEDVPRIAPELAQVDAGAVVEQRWLLRCSDGSAVPLDLVVQRLPGDRYLAIGRDLTEREKGLRQLAEARDAAQAANLAKSHFLAAASHDLRQPIQAINLFRDALSKTVLNEEQRRIADYISQSVISLSDLLNVLLDISRLDAGAVKARPEAISVEYLFRSIDAEFSPLASARSLRFKLCFPVADLAVVADGKLLQSLLGNLLGNALKYTPRGGILVGLRRRGGQALIQVWDTGIGIAPEHMGNIFEEYFQIGNPERDRKKGLGLGLSIVRRIAGLLGTRVVCRSVPGRGSVFEFRLPLAVGPTAAVPTQHASPAISPANSGLAGLTVVVVEDDEMVARAIELSLTGHGMSVTIWNSAEEALANPAIHGADFYISDFRLPGANGLQFLDAIQQESAKPLKAVLLTGDTSPQRIEITASSRWPVLFKPVELSRLVSAMEQQ